MSATKSSAKKRSNESDSSKSAKLKTVILEEDDLGVDFSELVEFFIFNKFFLGGNLYCF